MEKQTASGVSKVDVWDTDIQALELNVRGYNALRRAGIEKISELLYFIQKPGIHWKNRVRYLGEKISYEVWNALVQKGYASRTMLNPQTILLDENVLSEKPKKEIVSVFEKIKKFNEKEYAQWVLTDGMNIFLTCNSITDVLSYIRKTCKM